MVTNEQVDKLINRTFKKFEGKVDSVNQKLSEYGLVYKAMTFHVGAEKEVQFIDIEELGSILYSFIFDQNTTLGDMVQEEMLLGIIESVADNEDKMRDETFVSSIQRWLKYHVIPYIYENMKNIDVSKKVTEYSDEIAEERDYNGTLEHKHKSNDYWHSATRVHAPYITKSMLPQGHVLQEFVDVSKKVSEFTSIYLEKPLPKALSETLFGVTTSKKVRNEIISKEEIEKCIYPFDLGFEIANMLMSKEDSDYIDIIRLVDILYEYANEYANKYKYVSHNDMMYIFENKYLLSDKLSIPSESKLKIKKWLSRIVSPCINSVVKRNIEEQKKLTSQLKKLDYTIDENSKLYQRMSSIVRSFYESFYDESSLCLYYIYYVLNLKGNKDFDYEFRTLENKLYVDFYNYGIFAVLGELKHFVDMFYFGKDAKEDDVSLYSFITYVHDNGGHRTMFRKGSDEFISNVSKCIGVDEKSIYKIIQINEIEKNVSVAKEGIDIKEAYIIRDIKFLYLIEKYFGYFTRPEFILKMANKVFGVEDVKCHWLSSYGGKAWESISKTMLNRKNMVSKTTFVDTCWSLQHNTELFINKVFNKEENIYILKRYLTDVKNGKFDRVYKCAIKHNPKLDRYVYKNLILEGEGQSKEKEEEEKVTIQYLSNLSEEDRIIAYDKLIETFGIKNMKIYQITYDITNPLVEIIILDSRIKYVTYLDSIHNYLNKRYPIEEVWQDIFMGKEKEEKQHLDITKYSLEDKIKLYKGLDQHGLSHDNVIVDEDIAEIIIDKLNSIYITDLASIADYLYEKDKSVIYLKYRN